MQLLFNIDLEHYKNILKQNYINYSNSELGENLLWGEIIILNDKKDFLYFEADLLKFSYDIYDTLNRLLSVKKENEDNSIEYLFNMYQLYQLELKKEGKYVIITFNKKQSVKYNLKKIISEIKNLKTKLLVDLKILFPNYEEIKNIKFLLDMLK
ncbi:hypothetical protein [uncultured Algibacter sp.]|uniref:hypothetical protein n=1 Tax=uncultured Algibacter sp. TaxID=298659 RepID=UPI003216B611